MYKKITLIVLVAVLLMSGCSQKASSPTQHKQTIENTAAVTEPADTNYAEDIGQKEEIKLAFKEAACPFDLPAGAVEGEDLTCSTVEVPESRPELGIAGSSNTIQLLVAVIPSSGDEPVPDPLVMLAGGPGQSAMDAFIPLLTLPGMDRLLVNREIILIEQRGTKFSTPFLKCEEINQLRMEIMNQDLGDDEAEALRLQALGDCRKRFEQDGVNLSAYNSLENAADIIAVVDALGYETFNIYGGSYGSLLAQHILRDYPERVRSVVLDGVSPLPHNPNVLFKAHSTDRSLRLLFNHCQSDSTCRETYPDLESVYFGLVDQLNEKPAVLEIQNFETGQVHEMLLDGDRLVGITRDLLYITSILPDLPGAIFKMTEGDFSLVELLEGILMFQLDLAVGMYNSVICSELADFEPADMADSDGLYPKVAEVVEDLIDEVMLQPCAIWGVDHLGNRITEPAASDTPTLMLSGDFDPTVPPSMAEVAAEKLTHAYLYTFPAVSHGVFGSDPCALEMVLAFLDHPDRAPNQACTDALPKLTFRFPVAEVNLEPYTNSKIGISGLAPAGWTEIQPGILARASSPLDSAVLQIALDPNVDSSAVLADIADGFGLTEIPKQTGERQANGFKWTTYRFELQGFHRDLALTESAAGTLILVLRSPEAEVEQFFNDIFLPMVDAMIPLEVNTETENIVEAINLEPFADETMDISGLVPAGWTKAGPGTFVRGLSNDDLTVLLMQAAPTRAGDLLATLTGQLGLAETPESTGIREANRLSWILYQVQIEQVIRDIALVETDGQSLIIILRSSSDERDMLYKAVFLPCIDAFVSTKK